jgi:hypothetical protein
MTTEQLVAARLRALRRIPDSGADWTDVLERAAMDAPVPPSRTRRTAAIVLAAAITTMGFVGVGLALNRPELPFTAPTPEEAAESFRKAPGTERQHSAPKVDGETWGLRSYRNLRGEVCFSADVPGELTGTGCIPADKLFSRGPVYVTRGARQRAGPPITLEWDNQWIYGIAHPAVETLTLVNLDCSTVALALDEARVFHHVVDREQIRRGEAPYKLVARGEGGELLMVRTFAPMVPRLARAAGIKPPRPKKACA